MSDRQQRRITADGRPAPRCMVRFRCPHCLSDVVADAYDGPLTCEVKSSDPTFRHAPRFMEPVGVVRDRPAPERFEPKYRNPGA